MTLRESDQAFPLFAEEGLTVTDTEASSRTWQRRYGRILVASDLLTLMWVFLTAHLVWAANPVWNEQHRPYSTGWILVSIGLIVVWHLVLTLAGTRDPRVMGSSDEYKRLVNASLVVFGLIAFVGYVVKFEVPRSYVLVSLPFGILLLALSRWTWRQWLLVNRQRGRMTYSALVVGNVESVEHLASVISRNVDFGYRLVGVCLTGTEQHHHVGGVPVIGGVDHLAAAALDQHVDAVIVTSSDATHPDMVKRLSWDLEGRDVEIIVAPSLANIAGPRVHIRPVAGLPLLHVEQPAYRGARRWAKATLDRVGALGLLLLFSPILLGVSIAVAVSSRGPVFFVQERAGRDGESFNMIKFRTMVVGAHEMRDELDPDAGNAIMFKVRDDPRITGVGKFLRRYSLDELPQLFNVVKGDMSLVGPRPPLVSEVSDYGAEAHRRLLVRPGMTGVWQISGRSDLNWEETMRLDLYYVENWSMVGDLLILWKTLRAVVGGRGAY